MIYRIPLKISFTDSPSREEISARIKKALEREESVVRVKVADDPVTLTTWDDARSLARPAFNE